MIELGDLIELNPDGPTVQKYPEFLRAKIYRIVEIIPFPHMTVYGARALECLAGEGLCLLAEDIKLFEHPVYHYRRVSKK